MSIDVKAWTPRKLTPSEAFDCAVLSGDTICAACGVEWVDHHVLCDGSEHLEGEK